MRGLLGRAAPGWAVFVGLACASGGPPGPAGPAAAGAAEAVFTVEGDARAVLEAVGVHGLLDARARAFTVETAYLAGELSDAELLRLSTLVREEFAQERLVDDVVIHLAEAAPDGALAQLAAEWSDGPSGEIRRRSEASPPTESLDDFVDTLRDSPPDSSRLALAEAWVEARGTGTLYVLMQEALAEASYRVAEALRPETPPFRRREGESLTRVLDASRFAAVVSFLHETQTVPSEWIEEAVSFHAGGAGRWFAEEYAVALAEAIRAAGIRVADRLQG